MNQRLENNDCDNYKRGLSCKYRRMDSYCIRSRGILGAHTNVKTALLFAKAPTVDLVLRLKSSDFPHEVAIDILVQSIARAKVRSGEICSSKSLFDIVHRSLLISSPTVYSDVSAQVFIHD